MSLSRMCCCGGKECLRDCLIGSEIHQGCCHKDDVLLLWCERPEWQLKVNYQFGPTQFGSPTHERCDVTTYVRQDPVQAIYHYHDCYYRCIAVNAQNPLESLATIGTKCRDSLCDTPDYDSPCDPGDCCQPDNLQDANCCPCKSPWLSPWRLEKLKGYTSNIDWCVPAGPEGYDQFKWLVETTCHKGGNALASASEDCCEIEGYDQCDRLYDQAIAVVHFERWWKIADCPDGVRIYVPTGELGGFQTDDLVPKWWIYACSGIPLYGGDLCDAVRFDVITQVEAEDLVKQIQDPNTYGMPSQTVLAKLGKAGYLGVKDWREEQRQAFIDLHAKFPSAGYGALIENLDDMDPLGPFRKRMTYATVGVSNDPLLRRVDVTNETALLPLQAKGMIAYPGPTTGATAQADYDYWAERQWVYFRARPGGWTWAGWQQGTGQAEIDSILLGGGRGDEDCIEAFKGNPRTVTTCATCTPCDDTLIACGCGTCPSHVEPVYQCADDVYSTKEGSVATPCANTTFTPICEGLAITYNRYDITREFIDVGEGCVAQDTYRCLYEVRSFLVEGKRTMDSWLDFKPWQCRTERPPLPVNTTWPDLERTHKTHVQICNYINGVSVPPNNPNGKVYTSADLCCGGYCPVQPTDGDAIENFCGIEACGPEKKDCTMIETSEAMCPPHASEEQIDCIGYEPDCDEPTP